MSELTLSREQLIELTGYRLPSKQTKWLAQWGIRYFVGADGYPRVLTSDLQPKQTLKPKTSPNLEWLQRPG